MVWKEEEQSHGQNKVTKMAAMGSVVQEGAEDVA